MEFRLKSSTDPHLSVDITLRFAEHKEEVPFRSRLSDLNEIRLAIADAQKHILDPSLLGIPGLGVPGQIRAFSEDCVCVFAKGPNMHDLYFYDIPGEESQAYSTISCAKFDITRCDSRCPRRRRCQSNRSD